MNIVSSVQNEKMSKLQILKQLEIMEKSTENPGMNGMMQSGMGLGMGMQAASTFASGMQQMNMNAMQQPQQMQQAPMQQAAQVEMMSCPKCQAMIKKGSKFCSECGSKVEVAAPSATKPKFWPQGGTPADPNMEFCTECGNKFE